MDKNEKETFLKNFRNEKDVMLARMWKNKKDKVNGKDVLDDQMIQNLADWMDKWEKDKLSGKVAKDQPLNLGERIFGIFI